MKVAFLTVIFLQYWISCYGKNCYYRLQAELCTFPKLRYCPGNCSNEESSVEPPCIQCREHASKGRTVWIKGGQILQFQIDIPSSTAFRCALTVKDVTYSNDGQGDVIKLILQDSMKNNTIGNFTTESAHGGGDLWDVFKTTGQVGTSQILISGQKYSLIIEVASSDYHGVELDTLLVLFACNYEECPNIPNHESFDNPPEKKDGWKTCLIAVGWVAFGLSFICNIYTYFEFGIRIYRRCRGYDYGPISGSFELK